MADVPNLAHSLLLPIKFYWNTHRDITFAYILTTGAFSTAESSSCDRDYKAENIDQLVLYRKSGPTTS